MALQRLLHGIGQVETSAVTPESSEEEFGFPRWVIPSLAHFLEPFWDTTVRHDLSFSSRDFIREAGIHLRLTLDWSGTRRRTAQSLWAATYRDPEKLVALVDLALRNILIGYTYQDCDFAAHELDRDLRNAGSACQVREVPGRAEYFLERRVDPATTEVLDTLVSEGTDAGTHLSEAWTKAFGEKPDPGDAYAEALKAVEAAAGPVVCPNDRMATLGKMIGELRANAPKWTCTFTEPTKDQKTPVEVVISMMDMLMTNHADRHPPVTPITQEQAESAVHLALTLVQMFRSGAITRR